MAFASRALRSTFVPVLVAGSAIYATSSSLKADEAKAVPAAHPRVVPGRSITGEKLPIYPDSSSNPPVTLIETPHALSPYIAQARITTTDALGAVRETVQGGVSRWISFERGVEREVKSILPADENLTPGIIYVLISGLTGSVLSRTRSFPIRFLAPPIFTLAALPYFLPKTAHNLRKYISDVEDNNIPEFAAKHDQFNSNLELHWDMLKNKLGGASKDVEEWGKNAVEGIERGTGLKVADVVKRGQIAADQLREKVDPSIISDSQNGTKLERIGYVVEQKPVAEIVRPVEVPTETQSQSKPVSSPQNRIV